jgi:DNA-binding CsgD family transcriptional regulator
VFERLTAREHDVLRLIGQGYTNPQIARELLITRETVKTHVARLNRKLGVANRAEAVAVFERMHLAHRPAPDDADVSFAHAPEFHR